MPDKVLLDPESKYLEDYLFFENPNLYNISHRLQNDYNQLSEFIQWGRRNPVLFAEEIFGVEMMDYQKYIFMNTWITPYNVWLMSRNAGKSILGAVYLQTRSLLVPNFNAYILCGVGSQSIELFSKIEKLTYNEVPSFTTLTDVFRGEVIKSASNNNGFVHNPSSHVFNLYNGSSVHTLNGAFGNSRSKRSSTNFYDECMNAPDELFRVTEPFITQNAEFTLGVGQDNLDALTRPLPFQNQLIFASSAGTKEQYLYTKYREASLHMDAGDPRYFCIDLTAPVILGATQRGIKLAKPLLTQEVIDARLREDKEAGMREYFNDFTTEDLERQIVSRAAIIKNSVPRVPMLKNEDGKRKFLIAYDPARMFDNSVIGVAEVFEDQQVGWKMKIQAVFSLADILKENKTPLSTPEQVKLLKQIILDYNGEHAAEYENLLGILVDAGSGGAGVPITDFLCEDWEDSNGIIHRGLIDNEYNDGDKKKFPNAVGNVLKLISPAKYKPDLFESFIKMMELNLIEFTEEYSDKGYINLMYDVYPDGRRVQRFQYPSEDEEEALHKKGVDIIFSPAHLTKKEENTLKQIDLMKMEMLSMYRFKQTNGKDRFDLAPDKANKMHDDKAYVLALLSYGLAQLRREPIVNKKREKGSVSLAEALPFRDNRVKKIIG